MKSIIFLLPLLCLCLVLQLLLIHSADETAKNGNLLAKVCESSEDKNLCYSTFKTKPESQKTNLTELAMIALKIASDNGSSILEYISKRLRKTNLDPAIEQGLSDCSDQYLDAIEQLDDSVAALLADAYKDVSAWVSTAIADASTCQEAFQQRPGSDPGLDFNNIVFIKLCKNVLAVNKLLVGE